MVLEDEDNDLPDRVDDFHRDDSAEDADDSDPGTDISQLFSGAPRASAPRGAQWTLERLQRPSRSRRSL